MITYEIFLFAYKKIAYNPVLCYRNVIKSVSNHEIRF